MSSPFPGMDPYLESHWGDVHHRFITYACDQIQPLLPADLRARLEEYVLIEPPDDKERRIKPDLRIVEKKPDRKHKPRALAGVAVLEPLVLFMDEAPTHAYIEIRDIRDRNRLITVIEILSPINKAAGEGRNKYLQKRQELRDGEVSLVEIDLSREGQRPLPVPAWRLPESHKTPYQIWVQRGWKCIEVEIYAVPLRCPLPTISIPLRESDSDVTLNVQQVIEQCYRNGAYGDTDYTKAPEPPLDLEDARWADDLLREKGLRRGKSSRRGTRNGKRRRGD